MWACSTSNVGTFDHVGTFDLQGGHFQPKMWALSTMWANSTLNVGSLDLHVGMYDQDSNPDPNPKLDPSVQ